MGFTQRALTIEDDETTYDRVSRYFRGIAFEKVGAAELPVTSVFPIRRTTASIIGHEAFAGWVLRHEAGGEYAEVCIIEVVALGKASMTIIESWTPEWQGPYSVPPPEVLQTLDVSTMPRNWLAGRMHRAYSWRKAMAAANQEKVS
jgi:hypothetical protein